MKPALAAVGLGVLLTGCVATPAPQYALSAGEVGVFRSSNSGRPISLERIKAMSESELLATFGTPRLDRRDDPARMLRFQSDACSLFVSLYRGAGSGWQASFAEAYDPQLRPLPSVDQCAGSVAAQKRNSA
jgi:hypothetical protein